MDDYHLDARFPQWEHCIEGIPMTLQEQLAKAKTTLGHLQPVTKWIAQEWGWVTPAAFALGAWGVAEYLGAMICFFLSGAVLLLKCFHWGTNHRARRIFGLFGVIVLTLLLCILINVQRDTDPLSKTYSKWEERQKRKQEVTTKTALTGQHAQDTAASSADSKLMHTADENRPDKSTENPAPAKALPVRLRRKTPEDTPSPKNPAPSGAPDTPIDISATISDSLNLTISVENNSAVLAEGVFWQLFIYRERDQSFFSYHGDLGYIKALQKTGFYELNLNGSQKLTDSTQPISEGDVFTGSLAIDCSKCQALTYIVHFIWGQGGWICKYPEENGKMLVSSDPSKDGVARAISAMLAAAPLDRRVPISPRQP
jgi:hypothetical protein